MFQYYLKMSGLLSSSRPQSARPASVAQQPRTAARYQTQRVRPFTHCHGNAYKQRRAGSFRLQRRPICVVLAVQGEKSVFENELSHRVARLLVGTSIFLVGMMGSGKTAVGRQLSSALGYEFLDLDYVIEKLVGKSIATIFREDGESKFRSHEAYLLRQMSQLRNHVISTGGGAVISACNWDSMRAGICVWLNGPSELLAARVVNDDVSIRPLLSRLKAEKKSPEEEYEATLGKINRLMSNRASLYAQADFTIPLEVEGGKPHEGVPVEEVVHRLLCELEERLSDDRSLLFRRDEYLALQMNQTTPTPEQ